MPQGGSPLASRCPILRPPSSSPSLHPLPHPPRSTRFLIPLAPPASSSPSQAGAALEGHQGADNQHGHGGIGSQGGGVVRRGLPIFLERSPPSILIPIPPPASAPFLPAHPPSPVHPPLPAPPGRLVLHWKATKGRTIKMAVVASGAKAAGWFAVGFSPNGGMSGSNAIATDSSGSPVTKDLVGQSSADDAAWTVGSGSISTSSGKVTMK
ncbi:unnamed protein product [Closterium sp. NIES-54]